MKNVILFCAVCMLSFQVYAAKDIKNNQSTSTMEVKCYVELMGGGETIHFAEVNTKNKKYDLNDIQKLKIITPGSKQKKEIYRIYECVGALEKFTLAKANKLESEMLW